MSRMTLEKFLKLKNASIQASQEAAIAAHSYDPGWKYHNLYKPKYQNLQRCYIYDFDFLEVICKILNTNDVKIKYSSTSQREKGGYGHGDFYRIDYYVFREFYINDQYIWSSTVDEYSSGRILNTTGAGRSADCLRYYEYLSPEERKREQQREAAAKFRDRQNARLYQEQRVAKNKQEHKPTEVEFLWLKYKLEQKDYLNSPEVKEFIGKLEKEIEERHTNSKSSEDDIYISKEDLEKLVNETLSNKQSKTLKKTLTK